MGEVMDVIRYLILLLAFSSPGISFAGGVNIDWFESGTPATNYTLTVTDPGNSDAIQFDTGGSDPIDCGNGASDCTSTKADGFAFASITGVAATGREWTAWTGDITGAAYNDGAVTLSGSDVAGGATFQASSGSYNMIPVSVDTVGSSTVYGGAPDAVSAVTDGANTTGIEVSTQYGAPAFQIGSTCTTVSSVTVHAVASVSVSGDDFRLSINGNYTANIPLTSSFVDTAYTWAVNPDTSTAWTCADIDGGTIGFQTRTSSTFQVGQMWLEVAP